MSLVWRMGQFLMFFVQSMITIQYIKLVELGAIFLLFLTLKPDFGWVNCLFLTLNEGQLAGLIDLILV